MLMTKKIPTGAFARRAFGVLAAGALAASLSGVALDAPVAAAESSVNVTDVKTTSQNAEEWSYVSLAANFNADNPKAGQSFTVSLSDGLKWPLALDFPLVKKDQQGVELGSCSSDEAGRLLTCTLNEVVEQWDHVEGSLWAHGQLTDVARGQKQFGVKVGDQDFVVVAGDKDGDGTCDDKCDGVTAPQAYKSTYKTGWYEGEANGNHLFMWDVNVYNATSYTVTDAGATFVNVACTDSDWGQTWNPDDVKYDSTTSAVTWSVKSPDTVCRARFTTETKNDTASNKATVNGVETDQAGATVAVLGGGDGDGTTKPQDKPQPPTPPADRNVPPATPKASETPGTQQDTPDQPIQSSATETTAAPTPVVAQPDVPSDPDRPGLAHTGAAVGGAVVVAVLALGAGTYLVMRRRRA